MKKLFLLLLGMAVVFNMATAQEGKPQYKKAKKLLSNYFFNPAENQNDLIEASTLINAALKDPKMAEDWSVWKKKGEIYNEVANFDVKSKILNPAHVLKYPNAAIEAYDALAKAFEMGTKKRHKKSVLKLLKETESHLNNMAAYLFQDKQYLEAYENFVRTFGSYELFKSLEKEDDSFLHDPAAKKEQYLYTGYAAYYGGKIQDSEKYFSTLEKEGTDQPFVYEALFNINLEKGNKEEALKFLDAGRKKFGDDTGLLFAEINYYIKEGKLEQLTNKLEKAIELDPNNVSVYTTLGSVYDQLHTKAYEEENAEKTEEYFNLAKKYFDKAIEIAPDNFDAVYSLGALHYNSAAAYTKEINKYADDFSSEGTKKYNEFKEKMVAEFDKALPYFDKAYTINSKDMGVLQALSEIYTRKNDLEKAKKYREELNALKAQSGK